MRYKKKHPFFMEFYKLESLTVFDKIFITIYQYKIDCVDQ